MGACILLYRQNRFVAPRFPDSEMIATPPKPDVIIVDDTEAENGVVISVTGAANDLGTVKIAVYDSESNFNRPEDAVAARTINIIDGMAIWRVPADQLPEKMALAAYHDENGDEQLNRNRLGIPTERYGFSRNARGLAGPPSFEQTVIVRPPEGRTIELFIR